ncbi:hypothetical protein J3R30DRAFT_746487 [Lentinula aciculospora]|uniref:DUF6533 domain-containing protein n=1 Tax=Lentinula aciculospora TaxID=153920 RepID=A0A9W9A2Z7_9AGAR|nr:hypothetical protein J3R30DRAFT_746487 [Lentinula aciculospora]
MSSAAAAAAEIAALEPTLITLGYDLLSTKRYWVAITALWAYEYILTLGDEIRYAWKGNKNLVFWLFFLNRYLSFIIIVITNVGTYSHNL